MTIFSLIITPPRHDDASARGRDAFITRDLKDIVMLQCLDDAMRDVTLRSLEGYLFR